MEHPYRTPWRPPAAEHSRRGWDELAIPLVVLLVGGLRAIPALLRHEDFGAGSTAALVMVAIGLAGVIAEIGAHLGPR
jgi:hypothetical protein